MRRPHDRGITRASGAAYTTPVLRCGERSSHTNGLKPDSALPWRMKLPAATGSAPLTQSTVLGRLIGGELHGQLRQRRAVDEALPICRAQRLDLAEASPIAQRIDADAE